MKIPEKIEDTIIADLAGETSATEKKKLQDWIGASVENRKCYNVYCILWYSGKVGKRKTDGLSERRWLTIERRHLYRKKRRIVFRFGSVAAVLAIMCGSIYFFNRQAPVVPEVQTIVGLIALRQPEEVKLILASGKVVSVNKKLSTHEAGTVIFSDSTGLSYRIKEEEKSAELAFNELIVPKGGEYRLKLADETVIVMNAESRLRYPVRFTEQSREVWLEGEAYFDVAHRTDQPFIVHVQKAVVKVLGTSFNIMAYGIEKNTEITLIKGSVEVHVSGEHELLIPGHQVMLDNTTLQMTNRKVDVCQYIAWKDGILRFDDMPLEQLMNRLSRWYDIDFEFRQEELKQKIFTGGFRKYEPIDRILDMVQQTNDVKFSVQNNKIVIDKR